jgi:hypothetical protein
VSNNYPDLMGIPVNRALGVVVAGAEHRNARGFATPTRRSRSVTAAPVVRSRGAIPRRVFHSAIARAATTATSMPSRRGIGISSRAASCA